MLKFAAIVYLLGVMLLSVGMFAWAQWGTMQPAHIVTVVMRQQKIRDDAYQIIDLNTRLVYTMPFVAPRTVLSQVLPDGRRILFLIGDSLYSVRVGIGDMQAQNLHIFPDEFDLSSFHWSMNGDDTLVLYARSITNRLERHEFDLLNYTVEAVEDPPAEALPYDNLPDDLGTPREVIPAPDGLWLTVITSDLQTYNLNQSTGERVHLNPLFDEDALILDVGWSPDSQQMAFAALRRDTDENLGVFVAAPDGRSMQQIIERGLAPQWSADGRYLTVYGWDDNLKRWNNSFYVGHPGAMTYIDEATRPVWVQNRVIYMKRLTQGWHLLLLNPANDKLYILTSSAYNVNTFGYWR